jgi:hypothetical protein
MRITIVDAMNTPIDIQCADPAILGPWLTWAVRQVMTADSRMQHCRIQVWPVSQEEFKMIPDYARNGAFNYLTQDYILDWAKHLTDLSAEIAEKGDK